MLRLIGGENPQIFSVRISLRHKPVLRDRLFSAVLAGAFAHGAYLVYPFICLCLRFLEIMHAFLLFIQFYLYLFGIVYVGLIILD